MVAVVRLGPVGLVLMPEMASESGVSPGDASFVLRTIGEVLSPVLSFVYRVTLVAYESEVSERTTRLGLVS